jgi:hypothetical protein
MSPTPGAEVPLETRARSLIFLAARLVDGTSPAELDRAITQLQELARSGDGRRAVTRELTDAVRSAVTGAWRSGWEPADLLRLAGRRVSDFDRSLLGDAVAEELSSYATATLDPRWPAQLTSAQAVVWWPADQAYLRARADAGAGWSVVVVSGLCVLNLLWSLPTLQVLGALPGTADPAAAAKRSTHAGVDERLLNRVRALLAKAESTTFAPEAETFTAGAQALMARHSIDAALLAQGGNGRVDGPTGRRVGIENPYEVQRAMLLSAVAEANRCRTVWSRELGFTTVVGFESDLDAVETLFTSLLVQATTAMTRQGSRRDGLGRSRTRAFRASFLSAFASRIAERLLDVTRAETQTAANRTAPGPAGHGVPSPLLPVLAARTDAVDQALDEMFPTLTTRSMSLPTHLEGWQAGRSAADHARLAAGAALEG